MLEVKILDEKCTPTKAHKGDAGWDVYSRDRLSIMPGDIVKIPIGIIIIGKSGMYYRVDDKSGLSLKGYKTMGGIIDNTYRGECHAIIQNVSRKLITVERYQKVAQILVEYVSDDDTLKIYEGEVEETSRGANGFGSTGI